MRAGKLNQWVQFLRRVPGTDEVGQPNVAFAPLFSTWASVDPINGREFFALGSGTMANQVDAKIEIRVDENTLPLKDTDRASVDGVQGGTYDFVAVIMPEQAGDRLRIMAKRVVPHG